MVFGQCIVSINIKTQLCICHATITSGRSCTPNNCYSILPTNGLDKKSSFLLCCLRNSTRVDPNPSRLTGQTPTQTSYAASQFISDKPSESIISLKLLE